MRYETFMELPSSERDRLAFATTQIAGYLEDEVIEKNPAYLELLNYVSNDTKAYLPEDTPPLEVYIYTCLRLAFLTVYGVYFSCSEDWEMEITGINDQGNARKINVDSELHDSFERVKEFTTVCKGIAIRRLGGLIDPGEPWYVLNPQEINYLLSSIMGYHATRLVKLLSINKE